MKLLTLNYISLHILFARHVKILLEIIVKKKKIILFFTEERPLQVVLVGETTQENEELRAALKVRVAWDI